MWQLAEDTIDRSDLEALAAWLLQTSRLTQGPEVKAFETAWADWVGSRYAVFTSSGTTANLALVALAAERVQARRGDKAPVTFGCAALTWSTNLTPAVLLGHRLHLFDADKRTLGVSKAQVMAAIAGGRIDVLFATHLLGFCALDDEILTCAAAHDVIVIEDACQAHGAKLAERKVGTLGLGGTFSFYFGHHMSTIEGGMVVTDDEELDDALRLFRGHGLARESRHRDALAADNPGIDPAFLFVRTGLNLRNNDLGAFVGQRQLTRLDDVIERRNHNLARFLDGLPGGFWTDFHTDGMSSYSLPLITDTPEFADAARAVAIELGIEQRPIVGGDLSRQPFMADHKDKVTVEPVEVTRHIHRCGLYVGNHHHVDDEKIDKLLSALRAAI